VQLAGAAFAGKFQLQYPHPFKANEGLMPLIQKLIKVIWV
jgi:hypothetical protein